MAEVEKIEMEIAPLAERHGLSVYDIEMVSFGRPILRVFVEKARSELGEDVVVEEGYKPKNAPRGVTVGELEMFAKVLIPFVNLKELFPREGRVEVSSPGLNRKLRRLEHFSAAVGNPVGVTAKTESGKQTIKARLLAVTDGGISLDSPNLPYVAFSNILRAELQPDINF